MLSKEYMELYDFYRKSDYKKIYGSQGEELKKKIIETFRGQSTEPGEEYMKKYQIDKFEVAGYNCYKFVGDHADRTIIYIHGGGFFADLSPEYWVYITDLFERTGADLYIPQYPVAPESNCEPTYQILLELYQELLKTVNQDKIVIMGDSAGGGISLSFAMLLREKKLPQPKDIILISPCLRLTGIVEEEKEEAEKLEKIDPIISYKCMETLRVMWGGQRKKEDYLVNPYFNDIHGLGRITLFSGTWEILYLYNREFYERMKELGLSMDFYVKEQMMHAYIVFPISEAMEERDLITDIINRE